MSPTSTLHLLTWSLYCHTKPKIKAKYCYRSWGPKGTTQECEKLKCVHEELSNQSTWVKPVIFKVLIYYFYSILTTYIYEICNNLAIMIECKLDRGSIRSSPSTPYRLTNCQAQGQTWNVKSKLDPEIESVMGWPTTTHHQTTFFELKTAN